MLAPEVTGGQIRALMFHAEIAVSRTPHRLRDIRSQRGGDSHPPICRQTVRAYDILHIGTGGKIRIPARVHIHIRDCRTVRVRRIGTSTALLHMGKPGRIRSVRVRKKTGIFAICRCSVQRRGRIDAISSGGTGAYVTSGGVCIAGNGASRERMRSVQYLPKPMSKNASTPAVSWVKNVIECAHMP